MEDIIIDTRGLSCPEPVLLTKKAAEKYGGGFVVLTDNPTAFGNVQRFLKKTGLDYETETAGEDMRITVR